MDTDVVSHGNLEFTLESILVEAEDGSITEVKGTRNIAIYIIHKNVLNIVKQMHFLKLKPVNI